MSGIKKRPCRRSYVEKQQQTEEAERESQRHQENISAVNALTNQLSENQQHQDSGDREKAIREKATIGLLFVTIAVTLIVGIVQHRDAVDALKLAYKAMDSQRQATKEALQRADDANRIARDGSASVQRAWVYPQETNLDGGVVMGQPLKVIISYVNGGHEPALSFVPSVDMTVFKKSDWYNGTAAKYLEGWRSRCFATFYNPKMPKTSTAGAAYPNIGTSSYKMTGTSQMVPRKFLATKELETGGEIAALEGCFIYKTLGVTHHTSFCAFYEANFSVPPAMSACTVANSAD